MFGHTPGDEKGGEKVGNPVEGTKLLCVFVGVPQRGECFLE